MHVELGQQSNHQAQGQPDNVEIAAIDAGGRLKLRVLNTIRPGLVQWVTCGDIGRHILFAVWAHQYWSHAARTAYNRPVFNHPANSHARYNAVPAISQAEQ